MQPKTKLYALLSTLYTLLYWHCSEVQTPAVVPDAALTSRSIKSPAGIGTAPLTVQLPFVAGEQLSAVFAIDPGVPNRNVTVITPDCCEYTSSSVAVHPSGTHAITAPSASVGLAFGEFTA